MTRFLGLKFMSYRQTDGQTDRLVFGLSFSGET